jgi:chromosome segregation ATPase
MQKKNRELIVEVENRLRDYRASVTDTKEKAEAMQKRVFGKIEDQASLLTTSLEEIEKRQKNFITQTKVFERADTLKQDLQEAMEDLKGDLARIEVQRKDLFEIETSIARVKKLGDETSEKAAKFTAEKKRIDLMDSDFQRILGLSQSMELRLEQVTASHDLLQDIQLRIRKLEDYSKDIEVRYERLEKRREVLDTTTDGVDRNFALLDKVEKAVRGLDSELKSMPAEVEDLRKRLKTLTQGKDDADKAVERLITLDQTLRDVESRIGRMEQAREWIAGVETRLTETRTAAEEQVHTLATITKAAGAPAAKGKSADADLRQTVLKLARQGWGKEEISRATKLSLGEVELILELGTR